jgi:type VI secretion system protein VasG
VAVLLLRCSDVDSGAPDVEQLVNGTLLLEIAEWVLATMAEGADMASFEVGANKRGQVRDRLKLKISIFLFVFFVRH